MLVTLLRQGQQAIIVPNTANGANRSYTATLYNASGVMIMAASSGPSPSGGSLNPIDTDIPYTPSIGTPYVPSTDTPYNPGTDTPYDPTIDPKRLDLGDRYGTGAFNVTNDSILTTQSNTSKTVIGSRFVLTALNNPFQDITTQVSITGNDTGGTVTVTILIPAQNKVTGELTL